MPNFQVRDLMINVADDRLQVQRRGAALCTQDQPTVLTCGRLSPVMHVLKASYLVERAVSVAQQLGQSDPGLAADVMHKIGANIGEVVVANAAAGGGVFMPDPECGGTSYETIPPTLTPVVHRADVLQLADLEAIKAQVVEVLGTIDDLQSAFTPRKGLERKVVKEHLAKAAKGL